MEAAEIDSLYEFPKKIFGRRPVVIIILRYTSSDPRKPRAAKYESAPLWYTKT